MKKTIIFLLFCIMIFFTFPVQTACADMGPKPSVRISFEGIGDENCYATLLAEYRCCGPARAWEGDVEELKNTPPDPSESISKKVWRAFVCYEDADGYYYLQENWQVSDEKTLDWNYYPPSPFKVLLYFPETDTFRVSGIYEDYAFDSYFSVVVDDSDSLLVLENSYNYMGEAISLLVRVILTILLEVGIALLFQFRDKKQLFLIIGTNVVTQIILNISLNSVNYRSGLLLYMVYYIPFEFLIFVAEGILYCIFLKKLDSDKEHRKHPLLYAFTANFFSFIWGFFFALLAPAIV